MTDRWPERLRNDERGSTLLELLVVIALTVVVIGATFTFLEQSTRGQRRDQAFGQEITSTQTALARLTHDLRAATKLTVAAPNAIEFLLLDSSGNTQDIKYDCTMPDSLGGTYTRCVRLQSVYPAALPAVPVSAGSLDIQHVENGLITSYCNAAGTQPSGSVFSYADPSIPDTNPSPPACDEPYQSLVASVAPPYVQVLVKVPASGDLLGGGLAHATSLSTGIYLRNQDSGA